MNVISSWLQTLDIAPATTVGGLAMYPLLGPTAGGSRYLTLEEGIGSGAFRVTEVSESGSVPNLLVDNAGDLPVLILDGEELIGAKQNRIVNLTILVPPHAKLTIPVSCVEAGRWHARSHGFAASGRVHYATARAQKVRDVSFALRASGDRRSDQGEIWDDIARKSARLGAHSGTSAAAAMYERACGELEAFRKNLKAMPAQLGAVFTINGRVAGLELFDREVTWQRSMGKVVQSYGLDALDHASDEDSGGGLDPKRFLDSVAQVEWREFAAVGLGTDLRTDTGDISGAALMVDGRVLHLLAFPQASSRGGSRQPRR